MAVLEIFFYSNLRHFLLYFDVFFNKSVKKIPIYLPTLLKNYEYGDSKHDFLRMAQVSAADNLCKQFGPRSGLTNCQAGSRSKLFDTLMVFLKEFFKKVDFFKKKKKTTKKHAKLPCRQSVNSLLASDDLSSADNLCYQFRPRSGPTFVVRHDLASNCLILC